MNGDTPIHDRAEQYTRGQNDVVDDVRATVAAIWRFKAWVIATTLAALLAGLAFIFTVEPTYHASNQLFIDPRSKSLVDNEIVPTGLGRSSIGGDLILLDSQVEIIKSDAILRKVLAKEEALGLSPEEKAPGFAKSLTNGLRSLFQPTGGSLVPADLSADYEKLKTFRNTSWVTRLSNSYVLSINVRNSDPERAAWRANAIAAIYLEEQSSNRSNITRETTETLREKTEALRARVVEAERAVENYRAESGLIGPGGSLIDDDQLRDLNNRLVAAKTETSVAQARYDRLRDASVSDVLAGSSSEALTSQVVGNLRLQLADIIRRESDALARFGPRHPSLDALRGERSGVNRLLSQELDRIVRAAENNLEVARANEVFLQKTFDDLTKASLDNQQAMVRLRELEREAGTSRQVLEEFLIKAKQSNEQEELSNDNARVISPAAVPIVAAFPKKKLVMAAALFAGVSLGTVFAWLRALFTGHLGGSVRPVSPSQVMTSHRPVPTGEPAGEPTGQEMAHQATGRLAQATRRAKLRQDVDDAPREEVRTASEKRFNEATFRADTLSMRDAALLADAPEATNAAAPDEALTFQPKTKTRGTKETASSAGASEQEHIRQEATTSQTAPGAELNTSIEESLSTLATAINNLLPRQLQKGDVEPSTEEPELVIGTGGQIYGNGSSEELDLRIEQVWGGGPDDAISPDHPDASPPFARKQPAYPRPRSTELVRKSRNKT
ncbi:MAG: GumC family protein [Pseudomonadota bacterium]